MVSIRAGGVVSLCAALGLGPGCAEVISRSTVEISPRNDATPLVLGPPGGQVNARGLEVEWTQDGDRLALRLAESRTCESVRHIPVVRIERVDRKTAGGAMWFEYGLGAAALATGLAGLIRPESFSQGSTVIDGQVIQDTSAGYRIGGIFTGLGVILLSAAVVDTVRTRNEVIYTDAYRREHGGTVECRDPLVPLHAQTVELLVDEWSTVEPTRDDGTVRFLLPRPQELPEHARDVIEATATWDAAKAELDAAAAKAAEAEAAKAAAEAEAARSKKKRRRGRKAKAAAAETPEAVPEVVVDPAAQLGPRPEPLVIKGVLRIDKARALAVDFLVPYEADGARGHEGKGAVEPVPGIDPPPRPTRRRAPSSSVSGDEAKAGKGDSGADSPDAVRKESADEPAGSKTSGERSAAEGVVGAQDEPATAETSTRGSEP